MTKRLGRHTPVLLLLVLGLGTFALAQPATSATQGQTFWADGTSGARSGPSGSPEISAYATGVRPSTLYVLVTGLNGCTTDLRDSSPFISSDANGRIPTTTGTVKEGPFVRPDGTYDVCFAAVNGYSPVTSALRFTVGGSTSVTTTTIAPTSTTIAPTSTTIAPTSTTIAPTSTTTSTTSTTTSTTPATTTTTTTAPPGAPAGNSPTCNIAPDNSAASISAAIAGCPNGSAAVPTLVLFPSNASYTINESVLIDNRANLTVDLNGATITNHHPATFETYVPTVKIRAGSNVRLRNGTVAGNFTPPTNDMLSDFGRQLRSRNEWNAGVVVAGGDGVWIEDLSINRVFGDGVMLINADADLPAHDPGRGAEPRNVHVVRVKATLQARHCIAPVAVDGLWIEDVRCKDSWYGGIDMEPDRRAPGQVIRNAHVLRNTFENFAFFAVAVPADLPTGRVHGVEIRANKTLTYGPSCRAPIQTVYKDPGEAETPESTIANIVIEENELLTQGDGVLVRDVASGTVKNNRIQTNRPPGWCGSPGSPPVPVRIINSPNVAVAGNTVIGY